MILTNQHVNIILQKVMEEQYYLEVSIEYKQNDYHHTSIWPKLLLYLEHIVRKII